MSPARVSPPRQYELVYPAAACCEDPNGVGHLVFDVGGSNTSLRGLDPGVGNLLRRAKGLRTVNRRLTPVIRLSRRGSPPRALGARFRHLIAYFCAYTYENIGSKTSYRHFLQGKIRTNLGSVQFLGFEGYL